MMTLKRFKKSDAYNKKDFVIAYNPNFKQYEVLNTKDNTKSKAFDRLYKAIEFYKGV
jgi:hypothetical protein